MKKFFLLLFIFISTEAFPQFVVKKYILTTFTFVKQHAYPYYFDVLYPDPITLPDDNLKAEQYIQKILETAFFTTDTNIVPLLEKFYGKHEIDSILYEGESKYTERVFEVETNNSYEKLKQIEAGTRKIELPDANVYVNTRYVYGLFFNVGNSYELITENSNGIDITEYENIKGILIPIELYFSLPYDQ